MKDVIMLRRYVACLTWKEEGLPLLTNHATRKATEVFLGSPILNIPDVAESRDVLLDMTSEEAVILKFVTTNSLALLVIQDIVC